MARSPVLPSPTEISEHQSVLGFHEPGFYSPVGRHCAFAIGLTVHRCAITPLPGLPVVQIVLPAAINAGLETQLPLFPHKPDSSDKPIYNLL